MSFKQYAFHGKTEFKIDGFPTQVPKEDVAGKKAAREIVAGNIPHLQALQNALFAEGKNGVLIVFQAMDAAGKDSMVKHVFSGINPQGLDVYSFKTPSSEEAAHDYLWRVSRRVPPRGKIAIFNRSYYEDVLIARVHKLYKGQNLPARVLDGDIIGARYEQIRNFEEYLWQNGITILKFFLHISQEEQNARFLKRLDTPDKNWKFSAADMHEREYWDQYQRAYEIAINKTATKHCPWYVIPADKKWPSRAVVSQIVVDALKGIDPQYPELPKEMKREIMKYKEQLAE